MANDGSLGTLTEVWLISQIAGITGIGVDNVDFFRGIENQERPIEFVLEMQRERTPFVAVSWTARQAVPDTEGNQDFTSYYSAFLIVQNRRADAAARVGDGTYKGTNWYLEEFLSAIEKAYNHAGAPIQTATLFVDAIRVVKQESIFWPTGSSIVRVEIEVLESWK